MSMREQELARPGATIRYWSAGDIDAPLVVFLHGATLDHRAWRPQIDALQHRFRVVAPDLRGHGASTGPFSFAAAVNDVLALLERQACQRAVLVGLSLGGNIAQEVLRRRPDLVHALVAADTTSNTAARHPLAGASAAAMLRAQAVWAGDGFARQAAQATAIDPRVQQYVLEANANRSNQETIGILTALLDTALRPDENYRLPVPALLVHGEFDPIGDIASTMRAWSRREPLAQYAVVPRAGHASNLDNPAAFTELLTTFLDELALTPADVDPLPEGASTSATRTSALPLTGE